MRFTLLHQALWSNAFLRLPYDPNRKAWLQRFANFVSIDVLYTETFDLLQGGGLKRAFLFQKDVAVDSKGDWILKNPQVFF